MSKGITPSQTVGPFFNYGLTPDGKYALERRLHQQSRHARYVGRAHPDRGPGVRRRRPAGAGLHAGNLAGRRAGPLCRPAGQARAAQCRVPGFWPLRHRRQRRVMASTPSSRARCPIPTASRRRRISCSRSSRAACCCISTRGSISTARRPTPPIPCWRWCRPIAATRLIAAREAGNGGAVYRFDIRLQGDNETVFFDI